jgi:hypothetical protein
MPDGESPYGRDGRGVDIFISDAWLLRVDAGGGGIIEFGSSDGAQFRPNTFEYNDLRERLLTAATGQVAPGTADVSSGKCTAIIYDSAGNAVKSIIIDHHTARDIFDKAHQASIGLKRTRFDDLWDQNPP